MTQEMFGLPSSPNPIDPRSPRSPPNFKVVTLKQVDPSDKYSPHFLVMTIHKLVIWYSFDRPVAFYSPRAKKGVVVRGLDSKRDMHAAQASMHMKRYVHNQGYKVAEMSLRSVQKFDSLLEDEIKKEIIHTSSEIMRNTLGVERSEV